MEETYIGKKGQLMTTRNGKPYALQTKTGKEIVHGETRNGYSKMGCRCDLCCDTEMAVKKKMSLEEYRKSKIPLQDHNRFYTDAHGRLVCFLTKSGRAVKHGTVSTYRLQGCRCSECAAASSKAHSSWAKNNRDYINAKRREDRKINPEKHREWDKKKYYKDVEKSRSQQRAYTEKHKERVKRQRKEYYTKNRDDIIQKNKKYKEQNKNSVDTRKSIDRDIFDKKNKFSSARSCRAGLKFTAQEDALILSNPVTLSLALSIGRKLSSVQGRKAYLRKKLREQGIDPDTMQPLDNKD